MIFFHNSPVRPCESRARKMHTSAKCLKFSWGKITAVSAKLLIFAGSHIDKPVFGILGSVQFHNCVYVDVFIYMYRAEIPRINTNLFLVFSEVYSFTIIDFTWRVRDRALSRGD